MAECVIPGGARSREHDHASAEAELPTRRRVRLVGPRADQLLGGNGARPHVRPDPTTRASSSRPSSCRSTRPTSAPPRLAPAASACRPAAAASRAARPASARSRFRARDREPRSRSATESRTCRTTRDLRPRPWSPASSAVQNVSDVRADRRDDAEAGDHRPLDAPSCSASRVRVSATRLPKW